ncbi:histidine phosphatase family protein [Sulfurihydrogenibium sp.]|uniref:histidine phosphatase family protein n=1 Tax=Sulfurihydrogenibium sp. TaxID=2053621 RepID=UPI00262C3BD6|nr:histidine phosphatase family protein [Sulfurihydrogenibium sp.]
MKHIYLCRHGESEYNAKKIVQGHIDTELTEKGKNQAKALGEFLKDKGIKKIISSDLKRAYQTAKIVGKILGLEVHKDERIREMHFGTWEGLSYDWIYQNAKEHFYNWLSNPVKHPLPKQEDPFHFEKRLKIFLEDIKKYPDDSILVVGHGGSIQGLLCIAMGLGIDCLWKFRHDNTGLSLIISNKSKDEVKFINLSTHAEKDFRLL